MRKKPLYLSWCAEGISSLSLQKILGLSTLEGVLDLSQVNVEHIVYNMTHVNKHGVVNLEDKTGGCEACSTVL